MSQTSDSHDGIWLRLPVNLASYVDTQGIFEGIKKALRSFGGFRLSEPKHTPTDAASVRPVLAVSDRIAIHLGMADGCQIITLAAGEPLDRNTILWHRHYSVSFEDADDRILIESLASRRNPYAPWSMAATSAGAILRLSHKVSCVSIGSNYDLTELRIGSHAR